MNLNFKNIVSVAVMATAMVFSANAETPNPHAKAHKSFIARSTTTKEHIDLSNSKVANITTTEAEIDGNIFTEGWNSKRVNPFTEAQVPQSDVINVRGFAMPTKSRRVTSGYGYRAKFGRMHKGVDIGIKSNDTIYATFDGKVRITSFEANGYGNYIVLRHPNKLETVYGHLNKILVKPNQVVKAGQPIGLGGSTGRSTGPHLHFETRYMGYAINPQGIIDIPNGKTYADTYNFNKKTYTQAYTGKPSTSTTSHNYTMNQDRKDTYTVKDGDKLADIAKRNGISVTTLCKLNNISEKDNVKAGQVLKLK